MSCAAGSTDPTGAAETTGRWRLDISYDGGAFSGWAAQPGLRTVQGELEHWIQRVLRHVDRVVLVCAGRTDAGVHARGQVAHLDLDLPAGVDGGALQHKLARVLPPDLVVRSVTLAPPGFDARFSAVWRRYAYRLNDGLTRPDPLLRHQVAQARYPVDVDLMNQAGASLLGLHDFAAFCRRRPGATSVRTLLELAGRRVGQGPLTGIIELTVRADAFCHSMVRSLVGALVAVGSGHRDLDWLGQVARVGRRDPAVEVMPAAGLTLEEVRYPPEDQLWSRAQQARTRREAPHG